MSELAELLENAVETARGVGTMTARWERLLDVLDTWGTATEVGPGRIALVVPRPHGPDTNVEIVMTPVQWDDLVSIPFGDVGLALEAVRAAVDSLTEDDRYLVYASYELVPSPTPELPPDPEEQRLDELARQHPEGIGRWVAIDRDGSVVDELRPPAD